ncbi:hypothetical protein [Kangiella sp.]|uniref:hypothetical protein n=1 Tax=Kangiella sp. TaxID=1920245 RepID=UPI003A911343
MYGQFLLLIISLSFLLFPNHLFAEVLDSGGVYVLKSNAVSLSVDGTDAGCTTFRPIHSTCNYDKDGAEFGARTVALGNFARSNGQAMQFYLIELSEGSGEATPLLTQISGKANFNGFMGLVGGGQTKATLDLNIIDLGPKANLYPDGGKLIYSQSLASHELMGSSATGPGLSIGLEGGAPYVGASIDPSVKFTVDLKKKVVRDSIDFGLQVLLIRGHQYKLQFEVKTLAKKSAVPGLAVSQFMFNSDNVPPNLLKLENWFDGVKSLINTNLPNVLDSSPMDIAEDKGGIWGLLDTPQRLNPINNRPGVSLLSRLGLPTSFTQLIKQRMESSALLQIIEEGVSKPGAELLELTLIVETDQVELLRQQTELLNQIVELLNTPQGRRDNFPLK